MHHNIKGEKIYYSSPVSAANDTLNVTMLGETTPSGSYEAFHRIGTDQRTNMYTFEFIVKGKLLITGDKQTYIAKKGDLLILNRTASHYYYTDPKDLVEKYFFVCNGSYVDKLMEVFGITEGTVIRPLDFYNDFLNLFAIAQAKNQSLFVAIAELILKIMYSVNPLICESASNTDFHAYPLYQRIANYIDTHIEEALRLEDIANLFSCTPVTINRLFKQHYGITPKQYILASKMKVAKQLLSGTVLPINRISSFLSFCHQNNFANAFSKATGMSPMQYRKQHPYIIHKPEP